MDGMNRSVRASEEDSLRILNAIVFYPRGGSAQALRYLARALVDRGHSVQVVSGSWKEAGRHSDAEVFYKGLSLVEVDYTEAIRGFEADLDPMSDQFDAPLAPSYEDKPGVPDRVFYRVSRTEMRHLVESWRAVLAKVTDDFRPHVAHLHHLNHLHLAAASLPAMRTTPKVAHLHGTEMKMLEEMKTLSDPDGRVVDWDENLRAAAAGMDHFIAVSPDNVARAKQLLGLDDEALSSIPSGVDTNLFRPQGWSPEERISFLEELLVKSPRGWDESGVVGSISYSRQALKAFIDEEGKLKPILMFVGRFLGFKRVPLLIEAVARANRAFARLGYEEPPYNLLVCGGIPGEWEGDHPQAVARRLGTNNVFFCGWLSHETVAKGLNLADVMVAPSYYEPLGLVFLEAMATGIPVIATRSGGPLSFVVGEGDTANGWFSKVDDAESLTGAIMESVANESERRRRGRNAQEHVTVYYSWHSIAERFERVYRELLAAKITR